MRLSVLKELGNAEWKGHYNSDVYLAQYTL